MKERLPLQQRSIKQKADDLGLITRTQNCNVETFLKKGKYLQVSGSEQRTQKVIDNKSY